MANKKGIKKDKGAESIGQCLFGFYIFCLILSAVIFGKIIKIQLFYEPDPDTAYIFKPKSEKKILEPERGAIYAMDGRLLAMSTPMYQIRMDCTVRKDYYKDNPDKEKEWRSKAKELAAGLAEIYGDKSADEYYKLIIYNREQDGKPIMKNGKPLMDNNGKILKYSGKYVKIGGNIDHRTLQKVETLPLFREGKYSGGMIVVKDDTRQYPYGTLARRTIGYVKNNKTEGRNHIGLEGKFDYFLHGKEGYEWMKVTDNKGHIHNYDSTWARAVDGYDLRTTLDIDIQDIADKALRSQIEEDARVQGGCAIVMDVKTGAIRAMVNLLRDSTTGVMNESLNLAIGRTSDPGSVFKATTLMSLLEDGKVTLQDEIPTNHGILPGFPIDDHVGQYERQTKKNTMSVLHAFEISSNYIFRKLAIDNYGSDPKKMTDKLYLYNLAQTYDFDLDGFASPSMPDPKSKYWSKTDLGSIAIGYSITETPLHVAAFYNAIANKGRMMKPYLVESIEFNGSVKEKRGPSVLNGAICSRATADTLTKALSRVVEEGTGKRMLGKAACSVAGKTGTARVVIDGKYQDKYGRVQYQGTFVGFYPAENPKYTTIVVLYSYPGSGTLYGGTLPAKAFREIVDKSYALSLGSSEILKKKGTTPSWSSTSDEKTAGRTDTEQKKDI